MAEEENEQKNVRDNKKALLDSLSDLTNKMYGQAYQCLIDSLNQPKERGKPESCEKLDDIMNSAFYIVNIMTRIDDAIKSVAQAISVQERYINPNEQAENTVPPQTQEEAEKRLQSIPPELLTKDQIQQLMDMEEQKKMAEVAKKKKKKKD